MEKLGKKWPFRQSLIQDAPETAGVYALWDGDTLLYVGHASGGEDSVRSRLQSHFERARGKQRLVPSHYSWEICANPRQRERETLLQLALGDEARA
jgi:excinuclease UvrABC nuclease subunit